MVNLATMDEDQASLIEQAIDETDARLVARLTQVLNTPGISDKDRKLLERNLKRIRERSPVQANDVGGGASQNSARTNAADRPAR
jgi:tRNA C32,U32 (ribose-2'-O)-methylase TrmJ